MANDSTMANLTFFSTLYRILKEGSANIDSRGNYSDGQSSFTKEIFHQYDTFDVGNQPISNFRKLAWKSSIGEVMWFYIDQSNDLNLLKDKYNVGWWDEWDIGDGTIGQTYGKIVKDYGLIGNLLDGLQINPFGRRHIVDLWQYSCLNGSQGAVGLPPCAFMFTISVQQVKDKRLVHMELHQRSSDFLTANVINKTQYYALLMMIVGHLRYTTGIDYQIGKFSHVVTNVHIYNRHFEMADKLMEDWLNYDYDEEVAMGNHQLILKEDKNFYDYKVSDFEMVGFKPLFDVEKPDISI